MKLMSKREAAKIIGCDVEDVDMVMTRYGCPPWGAKRGRGGGYGPLLAPAIALFEKKRDALEAELLACLTKAKANPLGLHFQLAGIRHDLENSEAPQGFADAFHQFAVALDGE